MNLKNGKAMDRKHNNKLTANARSLRRNMTKEEKHLWYDYLRYYPVRFLRQKVIDNYIADFYCHSARLVVELDGSQHYEEKGLLKDRIRTRKIEAREIQVIRIPNNEVNKNFDAVCRYIDGTVRKALGEPEEEIFFNILRFKRTMQYNDFRLKRR